MTNDEHIAALTKLVEEMIGDFYGHEDSAHLGKFYSEKLDAINGTDDD